MTVEKTKHYWNIIGVDNYGDFTISIQTDLSQIQIASDNGDAFIDTDGAELKMIAETILEMIKQRSQP